MSKKGISKRRMAERLHKSRSQLERLLDPENTAAHLTTITRAARVLGKRIRLEMVDMA